MTNEINSSLTDMCMQLVADNASQVRDATAAPMRIRGPEPVEGRGRGRGSAGERSEPRALFRACATAEVNVGRRTPPTVGSVGNESTAGSMRPTVEAAGNVSTAGSAGIWKCEYN